MIEQTAAAATRRRRSPDGGSSISQAPNPAAGHFLSFTTRAVREAVCCCCTRQASLSPGSVQWLGDVQQQHQPTAMSWQPLAAKCCRLNMQQQFTPAGHSTAGTAQCVAACATRIVCAAPASHIGPSAAGFRIRWKAPCSPGNTAAATKGPAFRQYLKLEP